MLREQIGQRVYNRRRVLAVDRQPEQLLVARQVEHVEDRGKDSVDPVGWMREVHRPYAAGVAPAQPALHLGVRPAPVRAILRAQLG